MHALDLHIAPWLTAGSSRGKLLLGPFISCFRFGPSFRVDRPIELHDIEITPSIGSSIHPEENAGTIPPSPSHLPPIFLPAFPSWPKEPQSTLPFNHPPPPYPLPLPLSLLDKNREECHICIKPTFGGRLSGRNRFDRVELSTCAGFLIDGDERRSMLTKPISVCVCVCVCVCVGS